MAALSMALVVTDVPINGQGAPSSHVVTSVLDWSVTWSIGRAETISYTAVGQDAATYLTPGTPPPGTRIVGPSLDGGTHQESRMLGGAAQWNLDNYPYISESGNGLGQVLATARVGRISVQQVSLGDVFTAAVGRMRQMGSPRNTISSSNRIPDVGGLATIPIGPTGTSQATALNFTYLVDASVQAAILDLDSNRDTILRATETVTEHMGSTLDPFRAQFVIDSGDFGVIEGTHRAQTVTVGHKGDAAQLTFTSTGTGHPSQLVLLGSTGATQVADQCYSCSIRGGDTHHGLPDGGKLTAIKTIYHLSFDPTAVGDYRTGMPVIAVYASAQVGGVYGWFGDGSLHAISQAMGVTDLWHDQTHGELDAATDAGVYRGSSDPATAARAAWPRLGTMALKVSKLCKDGGVLYALVAYHDSSTHILRYPSSDNSGVHAGFGGWSHVYHATGIADFAVANGILYYSTNAAGTDAAVHRYVIGTSGSGTAMKIPGQTVAGDTVVIGLDPITNADGGAFVVGVFVRTSGGSTNLYYISCMLSGTDGLSPDTTGSAALLSAGAGLVDDAGAPVMVNHIDAHGFGMVQWSNGDSTPADLTASTGRGVYVAQRSPGSFLWRRTDGQSNLGDFTISAVATAPPRKISGRLLTQFYGITPSTLYWSPNGTFAWIDMFAQLLDAGPAFYARYKNINGTYPTNAPVSIPVKNPAGGADFILSRILLQTGEFDYILTNPASTAPGWAHRDTEIAQISTGALAPEIPISDLLIGAMARFLAFTALPQEFVTVESSFKDTADPLRYLRPTQLVQVNGPVKFYKASGDITYKNYANAPFYVLEHTIRVTGTAGQGEGPNRARTSTKLGKLLIDDRTDPLRVAADMMYAISRLSLYRSKGHH